jgi:hypothetical protein
MANKINIETVSIADKSSMYTHHTFTGNARDNLLERITKLRNEYSTENKKGLFSSKQCKFDCANSVLKTIDIDTLLNSTLLLLPNSYHLFFDYTVFKTYAVPELYDAIMKYTIHKISDCIQKYGKYEMHINLNTFSVSAFQRYKPIIELYSYECNTNHIDFREKINTMHIYNIPSTIETISQLIGPLLPKNMRDKLINYDKTSSEKPLQTISEIISTINADELRSTAVS